MIPSAKLICSTKFSDEILSMIQKYDLDNNIEDRYGSESERITAYIARVSNPNNQLNQNIEKLLQYCLENGHVSIFEHAYFTFEIHTTISISRQILRHRSFTFQEFSTRYSNVFVNGNRPFSVPRLRRQDKKNRQNSIDDLNKNQIKIYEGKIQAIFNDIDALYNLMINDGVAKENAREILPLCTETTIYMTGNLRSWIFYLRTRLDLSTQLEHRMVAEAILPLFAKEVPSIAKIEGWL